MKQGNLIWVLALAGAAAACNSGPVVAGCTVDPVTGQCSTEGGECGPIINACTNAADQAVYDGLVYISAPEGETHTGPDAASAIGSDCIFGTLQFDPTSVPPLEGCGDEALEVLGCAPNCPPEIVANAASCVTQCTQDATGVASPPGLSDECISCTGTTVACGSAFCAEFCIRDTNAPDCIECRCNNNCIQCFDLCTGPIDDSPSECE